MITKIIGIDCATQAKKTGLALGIFNKGKGSVEAVSIGSSDGGLVSTIAEWAKQSESTLIALDAPLGWPTDLGKELFAHDAGQPIQVESNQLFRRETDRFVKSKIGKQPLDVGADRIARTAHAAMNLLDKVRSETGEQIPLAWEQIITEGIKAIEVYPAATLLVHAIHIPGYKQKDNDQARSTIISKLREQMDIPIDTSLLKQNDNVLDAVLCVLAGMDFLRGNVYHPPDLELAKKEGWIWVRETQIEEQK